MKPLKKKPTTHQSNTSSSVSNTLNVNVLPNELTLIASKDIDFVKDYFANPKILVDAIREYRRVANKHLSTRKIRAKH